MCKINKPKTEFNKRPERPCGVKSKCRDCEKIIRASKKEYYKEQGSKYYQANKEFILKKNEKWKQDNPEKVKEIKRKNRQKYKEENNKYQRESYHKNKIRDYEKRKSWSDNWRENNKDHVCEYRRKYKKNRCETDKDFLIKTRISANFRTKMNRNIKKKYDTFFNYTKTSLGEYVEYLKNINPILWDDYLKNKNIHIDHIIPCNLYDFSDNKEVSKCWDKRNLRLLNSTENIKKGHHLIPDLIKKFGIEDLLPKGVTID